MNGNPILVEVLEERISNLSKKVDEIAATNKTAVDAAFASAEKAINKAGDTQKEYNQLIGALQTDVVRLKESQAQSSGSGRGMRDMYGWIFGVAMLLVTVASLFYHK